MRLVTLSKIVVFSVYVYGFAAGNIDLAFAQNDNHVSIPHGKFGSGIGSDSDFQYTCWTKDGKCLVGSDFKLRMGGRCYCYDEDGTSYGTLR
jgi:hypothetical protein